MKEHHLIERITRAFIDSKITPLFIIAALFLGIFSILKTPREEEPQIIVPMFDVFVRLPGVSPKEVEERITIPMEKKLWEIPGVEYIYSTSKEGLSMAVVRFYVGEDETKSLVKLYNKLYSNMDLIPPGASFPLIKKRSIDDVPILTLTLWSRQYNHYILRRIAAQLCDHIKEIQDVSETSVIGGYKRELKVELFPERLAAYHLSPDVIIKTIQSENSALHTGSFVNGGKEFLVEAGNFIQSEADLKNIVVGTFKGNPIFLRNVARVIDAPEEVKNYVLFGKGIVSPHSEGDREEYPAVTITVAKRKGKNATIIADKVIEKAKSLKGKIIPSGVNVTVTRNYGETAKEKSNELLEHLLIAVISVTILISIFLGWKAGLIVFIAVPVTLVLTLFIYYFFGYTLNRVTLFALIFSIGILVDDPIVDVENIIRHISLPENKGKPLLDITISAVNEVRSPLILATFTVIAAIFPMAFVRGLMGPYMRPIPIGASVAMLLSMGIAFMITPWAAYRILKRIKEHKEEEEGIITKWYRFFMGHLINDIKWRTFFIIFVVSLLFSSFFLLIFKVVKVKMLPFDNKSEFQIIVDMPEGTPLEETVRIAKDIGNYIKTVPEVINYQLYIGTAAPYNFNGLVRHYFLRKGSNVADIQINLLPKHKRKAQSHKIAKRIRPYIEKIAKRYKGARVKIVEVPPGPPVLQTLVIEVYGPDYKRQIEIGKKILKIFENTPGIVDADWYVEEEQPKWKFIVDKSKAGLHGIRTRDIVRTIKVVTDGARVGLTHIPTEKEDMNIFVYIPRAERSSLNDILGIRMRTPEGSLIPLGELVEVKKGHLERTIYRKNLKRVVYITGDVVGEEESPVYAILKVNKSLDKVKVKEDYKLKRYATRQPFSTDKFSIKWDGEWHITYEVFRDLGISFAAVLIIIYVLVVGWFKSYKTPGVIMAPIPLSLVGIIPAHALMGAFFTATSMIGFIAGAGIVVRNSIILVDFIEMKLSEGMELRDAVIEAGAIRFRPMLLTASAVIVGAFVILFDPIFQGLAISLMAGEVASILLSRMVVPVLYYIQKNREITKRR